MSHPSMLSLDTANYSKEIYNQNPRVEEIPFDSDRKLMTTVHEVDGKYIVYTKGGVDEFGTIDETTGKLAQLKYEDLFLTGDSFVFEDYAHFLSKSHKTITTMDNGETFPYAIDFLSVNRNEALIKITKR